MHNEPANPVEGCLPPGGNADRILGTEVMIMREAAPGGPQG